MSTYAYLKTPFQEDLINFEKKLFNFLSEKIILKFLIVEPKIDGISASLTFKKENYTRII